MNRAERTAERKAKHPNCPTPWKQRFNDSAEASVTLAQRTHQANAGKSWATSSYHYCEGCGGFHITSRSPDGKFRLR